LFRKNLPQTLTTPFLLVSPLPDPRYPTPKGTSSFPSEGAMEWKTLLAYITGTGDQELLLQNEYLVEENRMLRNQITGRVRLTDGERTTLAELGKRLGKKALADVVSVVKPETLLAWHRKLIARKFDGSMYRRYPGRPHINPAIEKLII
jgi:putative transposase